jgi:hypothetical protein
MRTNGDGRPVVAIDIDGTLADYHGWFLRFAELYLGKPMPAPGEINPGQPLYRFMGITKAQYREVKLAYRQGGMKRSMPCLDGAAEMVRNIRGRRWWKGAYGNGIEAEVWICTTRPYLRLDNIDPDTREWLRRNDINKYDALLFDPTDGDNKYGELRRQAGSRVACALEDLPEQAVRALGAGVPFVFVRDQPYNQQYQDDSTRWSTAQEAFGLIASAVHLWRLRRGQDE